MAQGGFRDDLYFRLAVLPIHMPPLREHPEDIPVLVEHFLAKLSKQFGKQVLRVHPGAMKVLMAHSWPGNVRELENVIQHALVMAEGEEIQARDLPERLLSGVLDPNREGFHLEGLSIKHNARLMEAHLIRQALRRTKGNRTRAAKLLEISHRALLYKIREYGLDRERFDEE